MLKKKLLLKNITGTTATYEGVSYSPSGWKEVYSTTKRTIYIIWDSKGDGSTKTSGYNSTVWKTVVTHEIGHALGHEGHTDLNSVMMEELDHILHFEHYKPALINLSQMQQVY